MKNQHLKKILANCEQENFVVSLLNRIPNLTLHIKKPRKTKYGTMMFSISKQNYVITVNENLPAEFFLYVFLHEYAHVLAHISMNRSEKPHGKIWQQNFFSLLKQAIDKNLFTKNVSNAIENQFLISKIYSKKRDFEIKQEIEKNHNKSEVTYLKDLNIGDVFFINEKYRFVILKKERTRYLCKNLNNSSLYKISGYVKINPITT